VRIGAAGNLASGFVGQLNEIDAHILAVRVRIDLEDYALCWLAFYFGQA
jgi:hypothetical protein